MSTLPFPYPLAPLQRVMLRDSLREPAAGYHAEQVEIRFPPSVDGGRVVSAWRETVAQTDALRLAFTWHGENPCGWEFVNPCELRHCSGSPPARWDEWLEADRHRPLLFPQVVPWRAVFWPEEMRFVWTFHHALLDGRSIARIFQGFLKRVNGTMAEPLAVSKWHPPGVEMKSRGDAMLRRVFAGMEAIKTAPPSAIADDLAVRSLGHEFLKQLESQAAIAGVTPATLLIEAWGRALIQRCGAESVVVEQLRSGPPQPGTAGFLMNLLPLRIGQWNLREQLLELRQIESLATDDFSPGVFPDVSGPWSSVIMIERATFAHQVGAAESVESIILHERKGKSLAATAHLLPDLRLEVEGPGRHELLDAWIGVLCHGG
jgi:hypothetical protein